MRWDPLFETIHRHVPESGTLLDVGCGYALPAVWLACLRPHLRIIAFDSHPQRLRIAHHVLDRRALVFQADARDWVTLFDAHDETSRSLDVVLCIDVLHHLDEPKHLLEDLAARMQKDATLLLRTTIRGRGEQHAHHIERWMVRIRGQRTVRFYEQREVETLLVDCGFRLDCVERDEARTETLFVARRS
jgi:2-polyprenyl-3-methyl-5-hydroxy-6-metoxy-1,4-benzoquinol methylase